MLQILNTCGILDRDYVFMKGLAFSLYHAHSFDLVGSGSHTEEQQV